MNRLLVIDDDEDVSAMLFLLLKSRDFEVAVITRSEDIFQKIRSFIPDVILMDVFLNGYDGRAICKQLKFHPESKHIPIIMISGHADVAETMTECGANDFILKPFDSEVLVSKINQQLEIRRPS